MKIQRKFCLVCKKKNDKYGICDLCKKNPFSVEIFRNYLANKRKFKLLKSTYSKNYSEIKNENTKTFWNLKFLTSKDLNNKNDPMTIDKIKDISIYLKKETGKLLDVGIGLGNLEKKLKKVNSKLQIFGIDTSDVAISKNCETIDGNFATSSIFDIPFDKNYFDIVICLEVLEHISPSRLFLALSKINKVLKKGGLFVVSVPLNEGLEELIKKRTNPNSHVRNYTYSIINSELNISGFNVLKVKYYFAFKNFYSIKSFLVKFIFQNFRKPNNLLIFSTKK